MAGEKPGRRVPLRQLLTQTQKCAQDLCEQIHSTLQLRMTDYRDLTRPVRRRSHYPTILTLLNSLAKLEQAHEETTRLSAFLLQQLEDLREHANQERINRR